MRSIIRLFCIGYIALIFGCAVAPSVGVISGSRAMVTPVRAIDIELELPLVWKVSIERQHIRAEMEAGHLATIRAMLPPPGTGSSPNDILAVYVDMVKSEGNELDRKLIRPFETPSIKCVGPTRFAVFDYGKEEYKVEFILAIGKLLYTFEFYLSGDWGAQIPSLLEIMNSVRLLDAGEASPSEAAYSIYPPALAQREMPASSDRSAIGIGPISCH